jgi:hypothetical protein
MQPFDQNIPVLTEIFDDEPKKPAPAPVSVAAAEPVAELVAEPVDVPLLEDWLVQDAPAPDAHAIGAELEALATASWTEPEWKLLEQRVAARILGQLDARIDATLDNHLRDSLADVLQFAMASLSVELRAGLQKAIEETVSRAVAHELEQLKHPHPN